MSAGRTTWWAKDVAWHRRELVVELGEEHGPAGPLVLDVLTSMAKEQRDAGMVKAGLRSLARETFTPAADVLEIVRTAARIGALDDLEFDEDERRFSCRVSGFQADQSHASAAARQQARRDRVAAAETEGDEPGQSVTERDGSVTPRDEPSPTGQDRTGQDTSSLRSDDARGRAPQPDRLPEDLSPHLEATARSVHETLGRVADAKGAERPTLARVGRYVLNRPNADHRSVAADVEDYWVHGDGRSVVKKDVGRVYLDRLKRVPDSPGGTLHSLPGSEPRLEINKTLLADAIQLRDEGGPLDHRHLRTLRLAGERLPDDGRAAS